MKRLFTSFIFLATFSTCLALQAAEVTEIRWGTDASNAPFEYKSKRGKLVGFDIDLGNAICAHLKVQCTWIEVGFDELIPALKSKKIDAINASMAATEKRLLEIDFSNRVTRVPGRLITPSKAKLQPTADGVKGKRIGVRQGTTHETYAKQKWGAFGAILVPFSNDNALFAELKERKIDAGFMDAIAASDGFLKLENGAGFSFSGQPIEDESIFGKGTGLGVRKEDVALKNAMNKALSELKANGVYQKIMLRHFEFDVSGG
jgi:lysine-arginine-ornithine-binding protein